MGKTMYKIMDNAQKAAYQSVQDMIKSRQADKIPQMMPPESIQQQSYMVSLVEQAICGYNEALMSELEKQGIEIPDICND